MLQSFFIVFLTQLEFGDDHEVVTVGGLQGGFFNRSVRWQLKAAGLDPAASCHMEPSSREQDRGRAHSTRWWAACVVFEPLF